MTGDDDEPQGAGYCRPPREHQFQKGKSGNPRGRPRKARTQQEILTRVMDEPVRAIINGREKRIPAIEAVFRKAFASALASGKVSELERLLRLCEIFGVQPADDRAAEAEAAGQLVIDRMFSYFDKVVPDDEPPE